MSARATWMTVDQAAEHLGLSAITLRRALERNARVAGDGVTVAQTDGISGRKIGRLWRVWLAPGWLSPAQDSK